VGGKMNENIKSLLSAIANNDMQRARMVARFIIDQDKTKTNKRFCDTIRNKLQTSAMHFMELPSGVKDILVMEDVSMSFKENRYYLSERERRLFDEIHNMYKTSLKLSEMGIQYLNSIMLHGESGTGKTLFGKFVAYKLELPFVYMNFSSAISSYLGSTSKNIAKAFEFIKSQKCVFMVDELDAIGMMRGKEDVGEMARITIALMQELDRVKNDTIIIGATNRLDMIDKALLRRFTIKHEVLKFIQKEMEEMIEKFLKDIDIQYDIQNIREYCHGNTCCQAVVVNEMIRAVAMSIRTGEKFYLKRLEY
jgi:SpoVK/Ycf46/Vps4 family AAA+-type ATPase